ncbi:MAG: preprotein translocase subunit YajC [Dongiaceae bacterium]
METQDIAIQILLVLGVMTAAYFSLVRPQLKRKADHSRFLTSLKLGDRVVTGGGLIGKIVKCDGGTTVEIQLSDSYTVLALRSSIESHFRGRLASRPNQPCRGHAGFGRTGGLEAVLGGGRFEGQALLWRVPMWCNSLRSSRPCWEASHLFLQDVPTPYRFFNGCMGRVPEGRC